MDRLIRNSKRGQRGYALLLVMVLLLVGAIIIISTLGFMNTGLKAGKHKEQMMARTYAADAGVEDSIWQILNGNPNVPADGSLPWIYNIPNSNGCQVTVTVTYVNLGTYKVESVATSHDGNTTVIESYLDYWAFDFLTDNAITSGEDVDLSCDIIVDGDVWLDGTLTGTGFILGTITNRPLAWWPSTDRIEKFYTDQISSTPVIGDITIDIEGYTMDAPYSLGPLQVDGELKIKGDGYARLDGPVCTSGKLEIEGGAKLILNNQALFSGDEIVITRDCTLLGCGAMISVNQLIFQPGIDDCPYIFLMSLESYVSMELTTGSFYGSVAGYTGVTATWGHSFTWSEYPPDINLPVVNDVRIISWRYK